MKHFICLLAIVCLSASPVLADGGNDYSILSDNNLAIGSTGIQGDKNHHNIIVDNSGQFNGDVDIKNKNTNINKVKTDIDNVNLQGQKQGQEQQQGQRQGQKQGQMNNWSQKFEDKRDHIQAIDPYMGFATAVETSDVDKAKINGSLWAMVEGLTSEQARNASGHADVEVKDALLFTKDATLYVAKGAMGEFMGYIHLIQDGSDITLPSVEAKGALEAMKSGATSIIIYRYDGKSLESGAANFGLSGGASGFAKGDDIAVTPSGGLGYGRAWTANEYRPSLVIGCYYHPDLAILQTTKPYTSQR